MTQTLIDSLVGSGYQVSIVDRRFSRSLEDVGRFDFRKVASAFKLVGRLIVALIRSRPQTVVFFSTNRAISFLVDAVMLLCLRISRIPVVLYIHTSGYGDLASRGFLWRCLVQFHLRSGQLSVCLSPLLASEISTLIPGLPVEVIPNTVAEDLDRAAPQSVSSSSARRVLFLSNLIPEKGAHVFVQLAESLSEETAAQFLLCGPSIDKEYSNELSKRASETSANLRIYGAVAGAEKLDILRSADVMVFPSTYQFEAQPLSVLEAFACGTAVIAFDVGGMADLVDSKVGVLLRQGDIAGLIDAVRGLLEDVTELEARQRRARRRYELRYSRYEFRARWVKLLEGINRV